MSPTCGREGCQHLRFRHVVHGGVEAAPLRCLVAGCGCPCFVEEAAA